MIKEKGYIKEQLITFGKSMLKLWEREEMKNNIKKKECRTRDKRYKNPQYFFCIVEAILVYANDKIYSDDISEQIRFSFEIHCPHHFFKILIESIFTPFINSNNCREEKAKANFLDTVIYCDEDAKQSLSKFDIYFFIGKWNIHFSFSELFRDKKFLIVHNQSNDRWVFGLIIGSKYSVTIDKANKVITFNPLYSN